MSSRAQAILAVRMTDALSESTARDVLEQACVPVGLSTDDATLLRIGSNAVFHLSTPVVVRISRQGADFEEASRAVAVARWLESVDYPAVRATDVDQPIFINEHVVTFWRSVSKDGRQFASVAEVGQVLAQLHKLVPPADLRLPELEPFDHAARRILDSTWLSVRDREFLTGQLSRLEKEYAELAFVLPQGVIHGDAGIGNVLRDYDDSPVVIDLDGFAIGPREWDLALTAIYYDSFGWHTQQEYESFVHAYGFDITQWSGYPVMRAVREFLMITWIIQGAGDSERIAVESAKRIDDFRTGASRKGWNPF